MNILNITKSLHERINSATSLDEILILSKTIDRLNLGTVKTVANYSDLLSEYPREGEVFFVENEEQLYYGFNGLWFQVFRTATTIAYGWGLNRGGYSTLIGQVSTRSSPVSAIGGITDWSQISSSETGGAGLRADGTVWSWGRNYTGGQLGDGTVIHKSSPVLVLGGFTDWILVQSGNTHKLGLRSNGTIWSWGDNGFGRLGDNTSSNRSSPVLVVGGFTDWTYVSSRSLQSIGLRSNGTLWGWGINNFGELGDGTTTVRSSPVSVVGGFTNWVFVSSGAYSTIGLRSNGTLWGWGRNNYGQLGNNTTSNRSSPVSVVGGFTDWTSVSCGVGHALGLRANGTLWAWGAGSFGRLGDNTTVSKSSPVSVVGGFTDWTSIEASTSNSFGIRSNGTLWAWGENFNGTVGDNTTTDKSSPVPVVGGFTDWIDVSSWASSVIALRSTT